MPQKTCLCGILTSRSDFAKEEPVECSCTNIQIASPTEDIAQSEYEKLKTDLAAIVAALLDSSSLSQLDVPSDVLECNSLPADGDHTSTELVPEKTYQCTICSFSTSSTFRLRDHNISFHSTARPYRCHKCSYTAKFKHYIKRHMKTHSDKRLFPCSYCDRIFKSRATLKHHKLFKHDGHRPFKCTQCKYAGRDKPALRRHMGRHSDTRPLSCHICNFTTRYSDCLKNHIITHTDRTREYKCLLCTYAAFDNTALQKHLKTHNPQRIRPHQCPHCDYKAVEKRGLNSHMSVHSNENPFKCTECDYRARRRGCLEKHTKRYHMDAPRYKCQTCGALFISVYALNQHVMILHSHEALLYCPECTYHTTKSAYLNRHVQTHSTTTPYHCEFCSHQNKTSKGLKKHHLVHHCAEKPFKCSECDYSAKFAYSVKYHAIKHHPQKQ